MVGLTLLSFKSQQRNRLFVVPGSYRKLIARPNDLIWKTTPSTLSSSQSTLSSGAVDLRAEFRLDSGCYATTMLEEISDLDVTYY